MNVDSGAVQRYVVRQFCQSRLANMRPASVDGIKAAGTSACCMCPAAAGMHTARTCSMALTTCASASAGGSPSWQLPRASAAACSMPAFVNAAELVGYLDTCGRGGVR